MAVPIFREASALAAALAASPLTDPIAVDGWFDAGKTTLAQELAFLLGRVCLDLDSFLGHPKGEFIRTLDIGALAEALGSSPPLVLSGVCMLEVLAQLERPATTLIYVKRMAAWGWIDEDEASGQAMFGEPGPSQEVLELRRYHVRHRPWTKAEYVFERPEV
jgi:hypothetical protein